MAGETILVVNDDESMLYLFTRILRRGGFAIAEARSGADAIARAADVGPALVVLDARLPDMHGSGVAAQLRANDATSRVRILGTSADASARTLRGADAFLAQPFTAEELLSRVEALLGR